MNWRFGRWRWINRRGERGEKRFEAALSDSDRNARTWHFCQSRLGSSPQFFGTRYGTAAKKEKMSVEQGG